MTDSRWPKCPRCGKHHDPDWGIPHKPDPPTSDPAMRAALSSIRRDPGPVIALPAHSVLDCGGKCLQHGGVEHERSHEPLDDDQLAAVNWWLSAPDETTVGEAKARFAAVGLTQSKAREAFGILASRTLADEVREGLHDQPHP